MTSVKEYLGGELERAMRQVKETLLELEEARRSINRILNNTGKLACCKDCHRPIVWLTHLSGAAVAYEQSGQVHDCKHKAPKRRKENNATRTTATAA